MRLIERIQERRRSMAEAVERSAMYDLHPELRDRLLIASTMGARGRQRYKTYSDIYASYQWVFRAIDLRAKAMASLPVKLTRNGEPANAPNPFDSPNQRQGASEFWRAWETIINLHGEVFIEIVPDRRGQPAEFWVRSPDECEPVFEDSTIGVAYQRLTGFKLAHLEDPLPPERIIWWRYFNPKNPVRGLSPISAVREGIVIDILSQTFASTFLRHGARPDFVILAPEGLTRSEREQIRQEFLERYSGVEHWSEPIVLESGVVDIKPLTVPQKDMEWIEQRKMSRDEVAAIFGVPDEMMGYGRNTYENYAQAERVFWQGTIVPQVYFRDHGLTRHFQQYYPRLMARLEFMTDLSGVTALQDSEGEKLEWAEKYFGMGVPYNALAEALSLRVSEIPGGDTGYLPSNLLPAVAAPTETLSWEDYLNND